MTIHKYDLALSEVQFIPLPLNAKILCVQMQKTKPRLWVVLDPDQPTLMRLILTLGTGQKADQAVGTAYIGTYQLQGGDLVFHVFDGGVQ